MSLPHRRKQDPTQEPGITDTYLESVRDSIAKSWEYEMCKREGLILHELLNSSQEEE
jgi:hypothetical protein